jgi:lysophospholipase L1-like esterase
VYHSAVPLPEPAIKTPQGGRVTALNRRKFVAFAAAAVLLAVVVPLTAALAADLYLHRRAERSAGLNRWGYRGPVVGAKRPGELRAVMLGGSTAFGYGVTWDEAIPALLERKLNEQRGNAPARVVNLGFNNEGAYSFLPTLQDFEYLDFDVVILYEGYNDLNGDSEPNRAVYRHESAVFRLTGYFPILPLALVEKARSLRYGGDLNAAYADAGKSNARTVFRPGLADRTSASALEMAEAVSSSLSRQLDRFSAAKPAGAASTTEAGCANPWSQYCQSIYAAAKFALDRGKAVAVVAQPRNWGPSARLHAEQQQAVIDMIARHFANNPRVRYVDLRDSVDVRNSNIAFDGMHLNAEGNAIIANGLAPAIQALAAAR